jgi:hypothetical protein
MTDSVWSAEDERGFNLRLARMIQDYWRARGAYVEARPAVAGKFDKDLRAVPYKIVSDLVNGLPKTQADRSR